MTLAALQRRVHYVLDEPEEHRDPLGQAIKLFIVALIALSVVAVMLETVVEFHERHEEALYWFEFVSVAVFSVEYALRLWSCVADPRYKGALWGRLKFVLSPISLIDLAAIVPFYLAWSADLRFLRALRLLRMARILKLGRYSESVDLLTAVVRSKRDDMIATSSGAAVLLIISSSLMYFAENAAQPKMFSSIPASLWWGVTTLTTVGYGDVYPVTVVGKLLAGLTAIIGVGFFALPAAILASGYMAEVQKRLHPHQKACPHCGRLP